MLPCIAQPKVVIIGIVGVVVVIDVVVIIVVIRIILPHRWFTVAHFQAMPLMQEGL